MMMLSKPFSSHHCLFN